MEGHDKYELNMDGVKLINLIAFWKPLIHSLTDTMTFKEIDPGWDKKSQFVSKTGRQFEEAN